MNSHIFFSVYWFLTYKCNLKCIHCIANSSYEINEMDLSIDEIRSIIIKLSKLPIANIILSGGEPLLHKDIKKILLEINNMKIPYVIETNGLLIDEEIINILCQAQYKELPKLVVSIDGSKPEYHDKIRGRGNYDNLMKKINMIEQYNLMYDINYTINKINLHDIKNILSWSNRNVSSLTFGFIIPLGRAQKHIKKLGLDYNDIIYSLKQIINYKYLDNITFPINIKLPPGIIPLHYLKEISLKKIFLNTNCDFPRIGITNNGELTLCTLTKDDFSLGDIRKIKTEEIYQKYLDIKNKYDSCDLDGVCIECDLKQLCKGSCRAFAYKVFGSLKSPHPFCYNRNF